MAGKSRPIDLKFTRLQPPANLSAGAAEVFRQTIAAVDADHFSAVDLPLLEQYAVAADLARQAQAQLDADGAIVAGKANPWLVVQEKAVRALTALSARLRICPQSRFDRLVAASKARPKGARPWDTDPENPLSKFKRPVDPHAEFESA